MRLYFGNTGADFLVVHHKFVEGRNMSPHVKGLERNLHLILKL